MCFYKITFLIYNTKRKLKAKKCLTLSQALSTTRENTHLTRTHYVRVTNAEKVQEKFNFS